jgi:tetratricopeptide (TPR) repeat protein
MTNREPGDPADRAMPDRDLFLRARTLFDRAMERPESEREAFIREAAGNDAALLEEVRSLLAAGALAGEFLGGSAIASIGGEEAWLGRTLGRYRITGVIAGGGMGVVFRAVQEQPRREVALKLIRGDVLSRRALQRFEMEAELLGRLDHPGIARIYDAGTTDAASGRQPYFVMELVDGVPLTDFVRDRGLSIDERLDLMVKVCAAVDHAHRHGIVHRDLKPANILVRADGQPKILDFGVARSTDSDIRATSFRTDVGQVVGTLQYMSPEQVRGQPGELDARADVYALGVLLYEVLTDRLPQPLAGKNLVEAIRVITDEEPSSLGDPTRRFPADLETIVRKCLEKDKAQRYDSPGALADDLERFLARQPIRARPPSALYRFDRFARRNRGIVLTAAAGVAVLIAGLVVSIAGWTRADRARERAEVEARKATVLSGFLTTLLASPDPWEDGPEVKVVDVLDSAGVRIERELAGDPEVAAEAHMALGATYRGLTRYDAAETHWRAALSLVEARPGATPAERYRPLESLGDLFLDQGRLDAADSVAARVRDLQPQLAAGSADAVDALHFLASLEEAHGRLNDALPLMEEAFRLAAGNLGERHPTTLVVESMLGNLLWQLERAAEAAPILESACRKTEELHGPDYPELLAMRNNLGFVYQAAGQSDRALATFQDVLAAKRRTLGDRNLSTAVGQHAVAAQLRAMGRPAEALPHHEAAVGIASELASREDSRLHIFRAALGMSLVDVGRGGEARPILESSYTGLAALLGAEHPRTRRVAETLAALHDSAGQTARAAHYRALAADPGHGDRGN